MIQPKTQDKIHDKLRHITSDLALQVRRINQNIRKIDDFTCEIPDYSPMIRVKSVKVLQELIVVSWHPMLEEVVFWSIEQWPGQIVFTSGYRKGDKGVHGALPKMRGTDWSSKEFSNPRIVEHKINQEWDYGKEPYQVCVYHQTVQCRRCGHKFEVDPDIGVIGSTVCPECDAIKESLKNFGPHFHLQSRDETRRVT